MYAPVSLLFASTSGRQLFFFFPPKGKAGIEVNEQPLTERKKKKKKCANETFIHQRCKSLELKIEKPIHITICFQDWH